MFIFARKRILTLTTASIFTIAGALGVISCTKNEEGASSSSSGSGSSVIDLSLLTRIPVSSIGFLAWDTSSAGYKKFKESPWGGAAKNSFSDSLSKLSSQVSVAEIEPYVEALSKSGLINFDPKIPEAISEGIVLLDASTDDALSWAVALKGATGVDLHQKLEGIESIFKTKGMTTSAEKVGDASGFSLSGSTAQPVLFVASAGQLVVSPSKTLTTSLFAATPAQGIQILKATPRFTAVASLFSDPGLFAAGYLDIATLVKKQSANLKEAITQSGHNPAVSKIENNPIEAIAFSRSMPGTLQDRVAVSVKAKDKDQSKILSALTSTEANTISTKIPSDLVIFLGFNGSTLVALKNAAVESLPDAQKQLISAQLSLIDSVKSFGVSVRNVSADSVFPDLIITSQTSKAKEVRLTLESLIGGALASQGGMPSPKWEKKDLGGASLEYFVTPFGVGAYMATTKDLFILASSERAVSDSLDVASGKKASLASILTTKVVGGDQKAQPFATVYTDFSRLAALIESVQGNLAMFTGGKSAVDPAQTAAIREMGSASVSVRYSNELLSIDSAYGEPAKEVK